MISMGSVLYCYNDVQVTSTFLWVISVLRLQMLHCLPAFLFIPVVRKFQISDPSLISFSFVGRTRYDKLENLSACLCGELRFRRICGSWVYHF